jgi:hypothetical protein
MANPAVFLKTLAAASATNIATSQAASAGTPLTLNGSAVTSGVATIDTFSAANNTAIGRRVLITSTSGTETAVITITGTNANGQVITETDTFSGASATLTSTQDFVTVTKIVPSGTIAGSLSAGTVGTTLSASSPWYTINYQGDSPTNLTVLVELVSGAVNYTVEYTLDDPNNLQAGLVAPLPSSVQTPTVLKGASSTQDGLFNWPFVALRVTIASGTGTIRVRFVQAGIG